MDKVTCLILKIDKENMMHETRERTEHLSRLFPEQTWTHSVQQPLPLHSATLLLEPSCPLTPHREALQRLKWWALHGFFPGLPRLCLHMFSQQQDFYFVVCQGNSITASDPNRKNKFVKKKKKKVGPIIAFSPACFRRCGLCFWSIQLHFLSPSILVYLCGWYLQVRTIRSRSK